MKLIKIFIVDFDSPLEENFQFKRELDKVLISYQDKIKGKHKDVYLFSAEKTNIQLELIKGSIVLSNEIIDSLILQIENCINIVSISNYNGRKITSSNPSIFLEAENENDLELLADSKELLFGSPKLANFSPIHKFDLDFCFDNLNDRFDGVRLFCESISAKTYSDKFREYFRLFEIAFKKSNRALIEPMSKFLSQRGMFNYTKEEVSNWITIRHKSVHANHKQGFLINRNLYSIHARIEQAAIDILFNKVKWNNTDLTRRNLYSFKTGVKETGQVFSIPGLTSDYSIMAFDETHTFPMSFSGGFKPEKIPKSWWYGIEKQI